MILEVNDIYTSYGLSQILFGISINVDQGECVALLSRSTEHFHHTPYRSQ